MRTRSVTRTSVDTFYDNEIIVDSRHAHEIHDLIGRWAGDAATSVLGESEALELTWIEVTGLPRAATVLRERSGLLMEARRAGEQVYTDTEMTDLDLLLYALRAEAPHLIAGKHRLLHSIEGEPYTGGGETPPTVRGSDVPRKKLPARAATAGPRLRVGVLDTPLAHHPQMIGRCLADTGDLLAGNGVPPMLAGHALAVAGVIAERAPEAEIIVRAGLDETGINASSWDVATKMMSFVDERVDVLNLSFAGFTADDEPPLVIARAVERLRDRVVLLAAVGNHGVAKTSASGPPPLVTAASRAFPAACAGVVSVGSVGAPFQPDAAWMSLTARGVDVECLYLTGPVMVNGESVTYGGDALWSGTSFSAAAASGAIADLARRQGTSARGAVEFLLRRRHAQMGPEMHADVMPPGTG